AAFCIRSLYTTKLSVTRAVFTLYVLPQELRADRRQPFQSQRSGCRLIPILSFTAEAIRSIRGESCARAAAAGRTVRKGLIRRLSPHINPGTGKTRAGVQEQGRPKNKT